MNSGLQHKYMEEVLGLHPPFGRAQTTAVVPVAIECEELTPETEALLQKILGTVPVVNAPRFETGDEPIHSLHALRFVGLGGRVEQGGSVHWLLPKLSDMVGTSPQVTELKKSAWALLRQFIQEKPA